MTATNLRAAGYGHTSSEGQRENTSIPNQQHDITRFVKSQN